MKENIEQLKKDIASITDRHVVIVAASKTQPVQKIAQLKSYGINIAGENKVQELLEKWSPDVDIEWHFIGKLQSNKVKYIVDKVTLIHSLDSLSTAKELQRHCQKQGKVMPVLIEVNIGGESSKAGIKPDELVAFINTVKEYKNIKINGLMTVMPINAEESLYSYMNELFESCKEKHKDCDFKWLSMGMSSDYVTAIKHGANMIRIGEKIFGKRIYNE